MEYDKKTTDFKVRRTSGDTHLLFRLAQKYLEQHESKVSRSHLYMEEMRKRARLMKRSFSNFKTYLIPWESKIKRIESKQLLQVVLEHPLFRSFWISRFFLFHFFALDSFC